MAAAGAALVVVGATLAAVGALMTWATVGVRVVESNTDTVIPGIDFTDGLVVLVAGVGGLALVMATRVSRSEGSARTAANLQIVLGVVITLLAGAFVSRAGERQDLQDTLAIPPELRVDLQAFIDVGPGAFIALAGGVLIVAGAVAARASSTRAAATAPATAT